MNTFFILLCACGILEFFYFKQKWNVLLTIITAMSWIGLMVYIIVSPPVDIPVGSYLQEVLILVFLGMAVVNLYMWFRNRDRFMDDNGKSELTDEETESRKSYRKSPMQMSRMEYKAYLKGKRPTR